MIDRELVIKQAQVNVDAKARKRTEAWNSSYQFAVLELGSYLVKKSRITSQDISVAVNDRTVVIPGSNTDISQIYYIKYGTGSDQAVMDYVDLDIFLKDYDSPSQAAGTPTKFTYIGDSNGSPEIKFDCPVSSATTITVWYYRDVNEMDIRDIEGPALVYFTKAHFYGMETQAGAASHAAARQLVLGARANDKPIRNEESGFVQSREDRSIANTRWNRRNDR